MEENTPEILAPRGKIKRGPGRPKGSKNRPKDSILTSEKLQQLYNRFSPYLTDDQKDYIQGVIAGEQQVDTNYEMQLLVRQMSLLFQEAATWWFSQGKISQDLGKFADSLRMAIKDLHDMQAQAEARALKQQESDGLVQLTGERPAMARIEAILGSDTD